MAPFDSNWCGAHSRVAIVPTAISVGTTKTEKLYSSRSMKEPARLYFDRENKATDAIPGVSPGCTNACRAGDGGQSWVAIASFCPAPTYDRAIVLLFITCHKQPAQPAELPGILPFLARKINLPPANRYQHDASETRTEITGASLPPSADARHRLRRPEPDAADCRHAPSE